MPNETQDPNVREITLMPSTLETIDYAMYDWINDSINVSSTTKDGWEKVRVRWVGSERSWQIKNDRDMRDGSSRIILPMITLQRGTVSKDPTFKGVAFSHIPIRQDEKGGAIKVARRIQQKKTSEFANATAKRLYGQSTFPFDNKKVVYETITMPVPTYIAVNYTVSIRSEYIQQMNEILQPFITRSGQISNIFLERDEHKYEGFIQGDISDNSNQVNLGDDSRYYLNEFDIKVLGYLIGEGKNDPRPKISIRENAVEVKMPREHVIFGDINEYLKKGKYRE